MRMPSRLISGLVTVTLLSQLSACGTLFFPDRRGQIEGKVDPLVVVLDSIGILFYVVPGLIAFGIDFATGAIYLPDDRYSVAPDKLQEAIRANGSVDHARLQQIIQQETGQQLPLTHPNLQEQPSSLEQLASLGLAHAG